MEQTLPYAPLVHAALRSLVRGALAHAARHGLAGEHHFYLTFRTDHPGVAIPARLKAQYPEEMTVVLQHQFWDLKVQDDAFSVGLSFNGVPASLTVPFAALTGFADPAMRDNPFAEIALMLDKERGFGLRLPAEGMPAASYDDQDTADTHDGPEPPPAEAKPAPAASRSPAAPSSSSPSSANPSSANPSSANPSSANPSSASPSSASPSSASPSPAAPPAPAEPQVVSLDAFRKRGPEKPR